MNNGQKAPRNPLFNKEQGEVFILYLDGVLDKKIAQYIFVDGMTNEEVAEIVGYSKRQIERIRIGLMKTVLKRLIENRIPKKPIPLTSKFTNSVIGYGCPNCNNTCLGNGEYSCNCCEDCGQALDWGGIK